ncbi:MAG: hypothetical protein KJ634_02085 [Gammaproteobacteria bacterium]|nr:hypothetical protein [Gammaproteobacteria bacterium]MBU1414388.1 hypothetical protein [Gammaproteobacteria bacterium]
MSVHEALSAGLNVAQANQGGRRTSFPANGTAGSFALYLAEFQSQSLGSLIGSISGTSKAGGSTGLAELLGFQGTAANPLTSLASLTNGGSVGGLSATGRNISLFDPESAYKMMSVINNAEVAYKAEFSELSQMLSCVAELRQEAQSLGSIDTSADNGSIESRLQAFANEYNDWVRRFDADMQSGGVLANTRAAQIARYELDQSIKDIFNGASAGLNGLRDLGFGIDPNTGLATLDTARLDSALAGNKQGAIDTLHEFSAKFARAAELLDADGNFIPRQLDNLSRAIRYIDDNKSSLQAEFGLGDSARPSGGIAQALAEYNKSYA